MFEVEDYTNYKTQDNIGFLFVFLTLRPWFFTFEFQVESQVKYFIRILCLMKNWQQSLSPTNQAFYQFNKI